jgi:hypothetical protein
MDGIALCSLNIACPQTWGDTTLYVWPDRLTRIATTRQEERLADLSEDELIIYNEERQIVAEVQAIEGNPNNLGLLVELQERLDEVQQMKKRSQIPPSQDPRFCTMAPEQVSDDEVGTDSTKCDGDPGRLQSACVCGPRSSEIAT